MTAGSKDALRAYLEGRLAELRREQELGQRQLSALEARTVSLREMLTRIAGAIQVLEESLAHPASAPAPAAPVAPLAAPVDPAAPP